MFVSNIFMYIPVRFILLSFEVEISCCMRRSCITSTCLHRCAKGQFGVAKVLPLRGPQSWTILFELAFPVVIAASSTQIVI
jgi:hypothetical protein